MNSMKAKGREGSQKMHENALGCTLVSRLEKTCFHSLNNVKWLKRRLVTIQLGLKTNDLAKRTAVALSISPPFRVSSLITSSRFKPKFTSRCTSASPTPLGREDTAEEGLE